MDMSLIVDAVSVATAQQQGVGFAKFLLNRSDLTFNSIVSVSDNTGDQSSPGTLQVEALLSPVDAIAPPAVKPKTIRRTLRRKKQRTRRSLYDGDSEEGGFFGSGEEGGYFGSGSGGGYDGPFGGSGGGGWGGGGWNFDGKGWEDTPSYPSWSDPAMNFVYEVICWIALSNCVHYAFKKVVRVMAEGAREKMSMTMRLSSIC